MNMKSLAGFILALVVLITTILTGSDDPTGFLDWHGALIVIGGTISVAAISFQIDKAWVLVTIFIKRSLYGRSTDLDATIRSLLVWQKKCEMAAKEGELKQLETEVSALPENFLKDCLKGILEGRNAWDDRQQVLEKQIETIFLRYMEDSARFKSLGKFPPAMGLLGAVAGMIAMLGSLGQEGASGGIGSAMAVALVATFYGIAVSNFFILPIGENLSESAKELKLQNEITLRGAELIATGSDAYKMLDELNAFLLPGERVSNNAIEEAEAA